MFSKIRKRLTYANVMCSLLAFVVLGGGMAVAAGLKKNSVKSKQIAANAVKTAELAAGAVTTDKLADNAATGAKVDESTLGQVPSAASADTAQTANSAQTAQNAENATNAQNATNATNAQSAQNATLAGNSTLFNARTVSQVRPVAIGDSSATDDPLTSAAFETVDGIIADVGIPTGGGDVVASATIGLQNGGPTQAAPQCRLESDGTVISQTAILTLPDGPQQLITLNGFANNQGAGNEQVTVECMGGSADPDGAVDVTYADLTAQGFPIG